MTPTVFVIQHAILFAVLVAGYLIFLRGLHKKRIREGKGSWRGPLNQIPISR